MATTIKIRNFHIKCRHPHEYRYKDNDGNDKRVARQEVPPGKISWDVDFHEYKPPNLTAPKVLEAPWADPPLDKFQPKWNSVDGKINRKSHEGEYKVSGSGEPLNIRGRTGLKGRGVLGKWGPNHAADPIVTRWKRDEKGQFVKNDRSGKNIAQFVSIQRGDTKEWAIPGGMVDPGEKVSVTVRREFMEEALDSTRATKEEKQRMETMVNTFFAENGKEIYQGYVDDPRNTDNSWMETVAFLFHDASGDKIGQFDLKAGDDAQDLRWQDIGKELKLYASHANFIKLAADKINAHW